MTGFTIPDAPVSRSRQPFWLGTAVLLTLALVPLLLNFGLSSFYISLLTRVFIYGIYAVAFGLLAGYVGLVSFGHALFFGVGAYGIAILLSRPNPDVFVALLSTLAAGLVISLLAGMVALRTTGLSFVFITMALAQLGYTVIFNWSAVTGGDSGLSGFPRPALFTQPIPAYLTTLTILSLSLLLLFRLTRSPFGNVIQAIRDNEDRTAFLGVDTHRYKLIAFTISGMLSVVAGILNSLVLGFASPDLAFWLNSAQPITMTWIGGVGTLFGPVVGAAFVLVVGDLLSSAWKQWPILIGLIYILVVMFAPRGLAGLFGRGRKP